MRPTKTLIVFTPGCWFLVFLKKTGSEITFEFTNAHLISKKIIFDFKKIIFDIKKWKKKLEPKSHLSWQTHIWFQKIIFDFKKIIFDIIYQTHLSWQTHIWFQKRSYLISKNHIWYQKIIFCKIKCAFNESNVCCSKSNVCSRKSNVICLNQIWFIEIKFVILMS